MSRKNKIIILVIVVIAVTAVLLISSYNQNVPLTETEGIEPVETSPVEATADIEFLTENPYEAYLAALQESKPIVVEFYADW
ncbi:MAG: hypothetical protein SCJ97_04975 [Bacillota bacterium]|nr:hypothetical protein [Bacillota bacterium]